MRVIGPGSNFSPSISWLQLSISSTSASSVNNPKHCSGRFFQNDRGYNFGNYSFLFNTSHIVIRDTATLLTLYFCHFFVYPHESRYRTRTNQSEKPLEFGSKFVQYLLRKLPWLQLERKIRRDLYWRGESNWKNLNESERPLKEVGYF